MGRTEKNGSHVTKKKLTTYTITTALFGKPLGLNNETYPEFATNQIAQNLENSNLYLGTDLACDHVATHGALEEPLGQGGDRVAATHHHSGQCDQLVNVFGIQGPHTLRLVGVVGSDLNDKTIMRMIIDLVLILPLQLGIPYTSL